MKWLEAWKKAVTKARERERTSSCPLCSEESKRRVVDHKAGLMYEGCACPAANSVLGAILGRASYESQCYLVAEKFRVGDEEAERVVQEIELCLRNSPVD
jgi:hypothetical protein